MHANPLRTLVLVGALSAAPVAFAALPFGNWSYIEPTGVVGPTDVIDVWVRFTLDSESEPLLLEPDDLSGFSSEDFPLEGELYNPATDGFETRPFEQVTGARLNTYFVCTDTFSNNCNGLNRAYTYAFNYGQPGRPSAIFRDTLSLNPGESFDYVFATFTPRPGGAPAGTYTYNNTGLTLEFVGVDAEGNFLAAQGIDLGLTCATGGVCTFTRTVTAVPEPQTWLMFGLGLAGLAALGRRRR